MMSTEDIQRLYLDSCRDLLDTEEQLTEALVARAKAQLELDKIRQVVDDLYELSRSRHERAARTRAEYRRRSWDA